MPDDFVTLSALYVLSLEAMHFGPESTKRESDLTVKMILAKIMEKHQDKTINDVKLAGYRAVQHRVFLGLKKLKSDQDKK